MTTTLTASDAHWFQVGQTLRYTFVEPGPPLWSYSWLWQDGDQMIFKRMYELFGWKLPLRTYNRDMIVTAVTSTTTLEVK